MQLQNTALPSFDLSEGLWALEAPQSAADERCLLFDLGGQQFATPIVSLRDILTLESITRTPGLASWVRGLTNVRGAVVGVVDLARFLGLSEGEIHRGRLLVCGAGTRLVAFAVAGVSSIVDYQAADLQESGSIAGRVGRYIESLVPIEGIPIPLLDLGRLLADDEIVGR
jgi:purine-binding chemotaxis protein CheW